VKETEVGSNRGHDATYTELSCRCPKLVEE
jgi:hypothetical protein